MADNLRKYTTQEVLNKVFTDTSGNAIGINSSTTKETLNAVFSTSDNTLNVALSGGTISGDVTISGDLTVSGSSTNTYDEQIDGQLWLKDSTASSATQGGHLRLFSDDGAAMAAGHRLGVIEFAGAEDASSTITVGARIEALAESTYTASENGSSLSFYTTDGNASQSEVLKLDSNKLATFSGNLTFTHSGATISSTLGFLQLRTLESDKGMLIDCGDNFEFRDMDSGNAVRLTIASSTGNVTGTGSATFSGDVLTESKVQISNSTPQLLFSVPSGGLDSRIHNDGSGNFIFGTGTNSATPTERMRIDSSGNVGIGLSPDTNLSIADVSTSTGINIDTYSASTGNVSTLSFRKSTGTTIGTPADTGDSEEIGLIQFLGVNSSDAFDAGARIYAKQNGASSSGAVPTDLYFDTYSTGINTNQLVLHHDGNVGIGTNAPQNILHLSDVTPALLMTDEDDNSECRIVNGGGNLYLDADLNDEISNSFIALRTDNGSEKMRITSTGAILPGADDAQDLGSSSKRFDDIHATNGTIQTSDERLKDNISDSSLGLNFVKALRPVKYKWKDYSYDIVSKESVVSENDVIKSKEKTFARTHHGLIAQEVEQVLKDSSLDNTDFAGLIYDKDSDRYGLRYNELIAPLIKAVQELSARVEELEKK